MRTFEPAPGLRAPGSESIHVPREDEPPTHPFFYTMLVDDGRGGWVAVRVPYETT